MRSVTHPLDNAALALLAKSSQLIGQAVQEDRWRDITWQIRGQRVPACTDLWLRVPTHQEQAGGQYLGNMVTLWSEHTNSRHWSRLLRSIAVCNGWLALRPIPAPTAAVCVLPDVRQCTLRRWTGRLCCRAADISWA